MRIASITRCLRLLAFSLLLVCAPVLDAANCCCRLKLTRPVIADRSDSLGCCNRRSAPPQETDSCCQHHAPASDSDSTTCCRLPSANTCGCCVASAPLTTTQRTASNLSASGPDYDSANPTLTGPALETTLTRHPERWPISGNRRQAVLCCWRN
jgi:hypothetical protein